ncbi:hypothetical protein [Paenibacillus typhae]|uniref:hypothetical protein n=1 Tax=Paenibacillus typhae TaxID=1174501 RepID=UPI001C8D19E7|nr:hypothetical protein [Paenibacillus typhae]MBY0014360.1 hypothetical protein [Paenibacillus typhae]
MPGVPGIPGIPGLPGLDLDGFLYLNFAVYRGFQELGGKKLSNLELSTRIALKLRI